LHYTINRNVINNYFIFDLVSDIDLTSIIPVYLTRYFSPIRTAHFTLVRTQSNNPEYLALEHINSAGAGAGAGAGKPGAAAAALAVAQERSRSYYFNHNQ
jgi:hypothetical protein